MTDRIFTALAAMLVVSAAPVEEVTFVDLKNMPADRLADRTLPAYHPLMARVAFYAPGLVWGGDITSIEFFSIAQPLGKDFCRQDAIGTSITPVPVKPGVSAVMPTRTGDLRHTTLYRYRPAGTACDPSKPFFTTRPEAFGRETSPATAFAVVRLLRDALRLARHRRPGQALPFRIACHDALVPPLPYHCGPLAEIDLGQIESVSVASSASMPKSAEIRFHIAGNLETTVQLVLRAKHIVRLRVDRDTIVY
jgi:hypothetical protein